MTEALATKKDRLSKFVSGETVRMTEEESRRKSEALARYLENEQLLAQHELTRAEFLDKFTDPDDVRFAQFVVSHHRWPIPACVRSAPRHSVQSLVGRLTGKCLLYRLGEELRRTQGPTPQSRLETTVTVLRRIPVLIEDCQENFLLYRDSYGMYGPNYEPATASGFVFYTKSHICIFAEDVDARKQSDLFMIQLRNRPMGGSEKEDSLRDGIVLMNGDLNMPTASRVLVRRLPESAQDFVWNDFATAGELKIELTEDETGNYIPSLENDAEMFSGKPIGSQTYSWYANFLKNNAATKIGICLEDFS
jgi:hypothetical protein